MSKTQKTTSVSKSPAVSKTVVSKVSGKDVDSKRSRAAYKAAATRRANAEAEAAARPLRLHHKIIAGGMIAAVIVFAFLGIRSQFTAYAASGTTGYFTGIAGKCLDNDHGQTVKDNRIQLWRCNNTKSQKWTLSDGFIKYAPNTGYCFNIAGENKKAESAYIQLWTCNGSDGMKFQSKNNTIVSTLTGYCATVYKGQTADETRLWMKKCDGSASQKWVFTAAALDSSAAKDETKPADPTPTPTPPVKTPPTTTPTPSPAPTSGPAPTGSGATAPTSNLRDKVSNTSGTVNLAAGTFSISNFGSDNMGVNLGSRSLNGAGRDATVIQMATNSSTKASKAPRAKGAYNPDAATTNPLYLMKVTGSPNLSNFTLKGTSQGHLYNGLRVHDTTNAKISNIKVTAIPGSDSVPPGETFGINDYSAVNSVYTNVEVDGSNVGASNFGANSSTNVTLNNSNFHDSKNGVGATFWKTRNVTVNGGQSVNNSNVGYNFERVSGTVVITGARTSGNPWCDYRMASDTVTATYKIVDPKYTASKLKICYKSKYNGKTNKQVKSNIRVIINGQDKTNDVVKWVS